MGDAAKGGPTLCPYLVTMNKYVGLLTLEMDLFLDFIRVRAGLTCNYHSSRAGQGRDFLVDAGGRKRRSFRACWPISLLSHTLLL